VESSAKTRSTGPFPLLHGLLLFTVTFSRLNIGVRGFELPAVESHCPLDFLITDGTICRRTPFPQPLLSVLLVHMTCLHMTTVIGSYRGFGLCYAKMHLLFGSAILRFSTRLTSASPPSSAPGPRDHSPCDRSQTSIVGVSGFAMSKYIRPRDSRFFESRLSGWLTAGLSRWRFPFL
jgi:hypothetical protein